MRVVERFDNQILEDENVLITLSDGVKVAARIWRPMDSEQNPVPAILEYLPYRKRDGTSVRDELTHPYFAGHGYAAIRVDMRGSGESEGLMFDEYLKQEQDDCLEILDWIAAQPWCSGRAGMIGISWGGFNGLQVAMRRPEPLKAVISICSTVDRYADDIHYKGGCLLSENLGWSSTMLAYSSRPPDPALAGDGWREMWLSRLENEPHLAETWFEHQQRDDYWKHGSLCEDYKAVEIPVLAVGGWGDAYKNAVPLLVENLKHTCCKGIVGPWVHKYPHFAVPGPQIGFLQECLRWWDRWLKDKPTGVEEDPDYRVFCQEGGAPKAQYDLRPGRWISEPQWPSRNIQVRQLFLNKEGIEEKAALYAPVTSRSPEDTGQSSGEYCAIWLGPELPSDQRVDDGRSIVFDSEPLDSPAEILGAPEVRLRLKVDRPQAHIAVRLCGVTPDGAVERVTYGVLNLSQRDSREAPKPMEPGRETEVRLRLDHCAHRFPAGHRVRLSVSNAYWPLTWPDPEPVTLTVIAGASSLLLPLRQERGQPEPRFEDPESAPPLPQRVVREASHERRFSHSLVDGLSTLEILDDFGEAENLSHGLMTGAVAREFYSIDPNDPTSAKMETHWTESLSRGEVSVRTETYAALSCDKEAFLLKARIEAYEGGRMIFQKDFEKKIARRFL